MSDKLKLTSEQFVSLRDFAIQEAENFNLGHESTTIVVQPDLREAVKSFTTIFEDVAQETSGRLSLVRQYSLLNKLRPIPVGEQQALWRSDITNLRRLT